MYTGAYWQQAFQLTRIAYLPRLIRSTTNALFCTWLTPMALNLMKRRKYFQQHSHLAHFGSSLVTGTASGLIMNSLEFVAKRTVITTDIKTMKAMSSWRVFTHAIHAEGFKCLLKCSAISLSFHSA